MSQKQKIKNDRKARKKKSQTDIVCFLRRVTAILKRFNITKLFNKRIPAGEKKSKSIENR